MSKKQQVNWQPIEKLPLFAQIIEGMLPMTQENYNTMSKAKSKPHVFDDYTINRTFKIYNEQLDNIALYEEQFSRWLNLELTLEQTKKIAELKKILEDTKKLTNELLAMADNFKDKTIDKIMAMDEAELAINFLSGKLKF